MIFKSQFVNTPVISGEKNSGRMFTDQVGPEPIAKQIRNMLLLGKSVEEAKRKAYFQDHGEYKGFSDFPEPDVANNKFVDDFEKMSYAQALARDVDASLKADLEAKNARERLATASKQVQTMIDAERASAAPVAPPVAPTT